MIQEYLFINDTHREEIEKYAPDKVVRGIYFLAFSVMLFPA